MPAGADPQPADDAESSEQLPPEEAAAAELARLRALSSADDDLHRARQDAEQARRDARDARAAAEAATAAVAKAEGEAASMRAELATEREGRAQERAKAAEEAARQQADTAEAGKRLRQLQADHARVCDERDRQAEEAKEEMKRERRRYDEKESEAQRYAVESDSRLALVDDELRRARDAERAAAEERERLGREDQRNTVMLRLYCDQIAQKDADLAALTARCADGERERAALSDALRGTEAELSEARRAAEAREAELLRAEAELRNELAGAEGRAAAAEEQRAAAAAELEETRGKYHDHMRLAKKQDREAFEEQARLRQEGARLRDALRDAEAGRERALAEGGVLKERMEAEAAELRGAADAARRGAQETDTRLSQQVAELTAEREKLSISLAQVQGQVKSSDRDNFDKIQRLTSEGDQLRDQLELAAQNHQDAVETMERQKATVAAERDAAHRRIEELDQELAASEQKAKDATILSWHERDQFKQLAAQRGEEIAALKARLHDQHVEQETELRTVRKREHDDKVERRAEILSSEDRLHRVSAELGHVSLARDLAEGQLAEERAAASSTKADLSGRVEALEEQCASRGEAVARLEAQLVAQYDARALAQQNEELKASMQTYKNQIASLNHTVAALRVEADIVDNHSTKALQEANAGCLRRIGELQDRVEGQEHLLAHCVPLAEGAAGCTPALQKECAAWRRHRAGEPAGELLASRDGRPQPLPPPHTAAGAGAAAARARPAADV